MQNRSMFTALAVLTAATLAAAVLAGCSSVFSGSVSGTVYDAATYSQDDPDTLGNIEVFLYQTEEDRDADFDTLTDAGGDGADSGAGEPTLFYDTTATAGDGTFTLNYVWNTLFPDYGDTGDREEVFLIFHDPTGEFATLKKSAVVISQFTSDVVALMSAARARATVTGTVENAISGAGLGDVTVTGFLPGSWEYDDAGGLTNVDWTDADRAFRVTTGDGGGYTASFTFPKKLPADAAADADERIRLRLLFSRTGFETEADGDDDLSAPGTPADINGDGTDDVFYESPLIIAGVDTAMDTIGLKPTEFTVTVDGKVWLDDGGGNAGSLVKEDPDDTDPAVGPDTATNGEVVILTVTDPASGDTREYRTTTERSGVGTDAEDGTFSIGGVTWKDSGYSGTQSTANATITVEGANNIYVPAGGTVELISGTGNYVEVLFD